MLTSTRLRVTAAPRTVDLGCSRVREEWLARHVRLRAHVDAELERVDLGGKGAEGVAEQARDERAPGGALGSDALLMRGHLSCIDRYSRGGAPACCTAGISVSR